MEPEPRERRRARRSFLGGRRTSGSTRDAVTGLMNGEAFTVVAEHVLGHCGRAGEPSLLVCCALDEVAGESELARSRRLREAASGLAGAMRGEDVLGRTGWLELSALLPGTAEDDALLVAERLAALEVAVGWAGAPSHSRGVAELLEGARAGAQRALKPGG